MKPCFAFVTAHINIKSIESEYRPIKAKHGFYRKASFGKMNISWFFKYFFFLLIFTCNAIGQTAAIGIKGRNEIVIAADSKVTGTNFSFCKIRPVLNYFYTLSNLAEVPEIGFSVPQIIDTTFKTNRTFIENIDASIENIKRAYPSAIKKILKSKDSTNFRMKFEKGDSIILQIIFAGKNFSRLVMYNRNFRMHRYKKTTFTITQKNCEIGCETIYFIGKDSEMVAYARRNFPDRNNIIWADYSKRLIEEAIFYNRDTVGYPINILRIPLVGETEWIDPKPPCPSPN